MKSQESRSKAKERFKHQQEVVKRWFDKHKAGNKEFEVGDLVLKWDHPHDEKGKHTKFQQLWVGPFQIASNLEQAKCKSTKNKKQSNHLFIYKANSKILRKMRFEN